MFADYFFINMVSSYSAAGPAVTRWLPLGTWGALPRQLMACWRQIGAEGGYFLYTSDRLASSWAGRITARRARPVLGGAVMAMGVVHRRVRLMGKPPGMPGRFVYGWPMPVCPLRAGQNVWGTVEEARDSPPPRPATSPPLAEIQGGGGGGGGGGNFSRGSSGRVNFMISNFTGVIAGCDQGLVPDPRWGVGRGTMVWLGALSYLFLVGKVEPCRHWKKGPLAADRETCGWHCGGGTWASLLGLVGVFMAANRRWSSIAHETFWDAFPPGRSTAGDQARF